MIVVNPVHEPVQPRAHACLGLEVEEPRDESNTH